MGSSPFLKWGGEDGWGGAGEGRGLLLLCFRVCSVPVIQRIDAPPLLTVSASDPGLDSGFECVLVSGGLDQPWSWTRRTCVTLCVGQLPMWDGIISGTQSSVSSPRLYLSVNMNVDIHVFIIPASTFSFCCCIFSCFYTLISSFYVFLLILCSYMFPVVELCLSDKHLESRPFVALCVLCFLFPAVSDNAV